MADSEIKASDEAPATSEQPSTEQPSAQPSTGSAGEQTVSAVPSQTQVADSSASADPAQAQALNLQSAAQVPVFDPTTLNGISDPQFDPSTFQVGMNGFEMTDPNYMMTDMTFQTPMMGMPMAQPISADEIALYDRQIRLWGVQAQEKIRSANILLIGLKGLGAEIAKNLVLAGVGTLTILEHEQVSEDDLGTNFFVTEQQVGQNRAEAAKSEIEKLNPRVNLFIDPDVVFTKMPEYFMSFDITIATGLPPNAISSINDTCRTYGRKFYAADTQGMYGYIFADLVIHQFTQERLQPNVPTKPGNEETSTRMVINVTEKVENGKKMEVVLKQESYAPFLLANASPLPAELTKTVAKRKKITPLLSCLRALFNFQNQVGRLPGATPQDLAIYTKLAHDKHLELTLPAETMKADFLRSFLQNLGSEISPVAAYLGGRLAQDVINVLGQREQPIQNMLLFDGETFTAPVYSLQPVFDDSLAATMGMDMAAGMNGTEMGAVDMAAAAAGPAGMNGTAATA